jgi:uncharacterized protein (TIGR03435 family)
LCAAFAQTPPKLAFEVVSVKVEPSTDTQALVRDGRIHYSADDAHMDMGAIPMNALVSRAFELPIDQVKGPGWMADARYNIVAKIPSGATQTQIPAMLRSMLEERFKLAVHQEQKILPVYQIKVASSPLKVKEYVAVENDRRRPHACAGPAEHKDCHQMTMEALASILTRMTNAGAPGALDRPVIDATGLKGEFDFEMAFGMVLVGDPRDSGSLENARVISPIPSLKALGLTLEPATHAFEYVIVDHLERVPTEN